MPELPDIQIYIEALEARILNQPLENVRLANPFVLRSVRPGISELVGRTVAGVQRLGKQIVICFSDDFFLVIHLMIAGRFQWTDRAKKLPGRTALAGLDFPNGALILTEAGSKRRASIHVVRGRTALAEFDRGALEVLPSTFQQFREALVRENHTLKRALTDPRLFSGIGNAYSDEILHRARLSPLTLTLRLDDESTRRLYEAAQSTLQGWIERLRAETGSLFPSKVTAFRREMAVHGRYGEPCPVCGSPIQRIVYSENECNYCPKCQTGGKLLADRALSRLLRKDWPQTIEELEKHFEKRR